MIGKTLGYRLFRWGSIPSRRQGALASEGIRLGDEGLPITLNYRNYRAPGKRFSRRQSVGSGAVVVTPLRLAVFYYRWPILDIPLADPRLDKLAVTTSSSRTLQISFDAADLDTQQSGQVTVRLRTPLARDIAALIAGATRF